MKSKFSPILLILVLIAYFLIGSLWTEVRILKGENTLPGFLKTIQTKTVSEAPKVDMEITSDDPVRGDKNAPLTIVEFADYQCPFCGATSGLNEEMVSYMKKYESTWQPMMPNLLKDYVQTGKVKVVYKDFAFLDDGTEKGESLLSAMAAHCAADQGKYWEFHDYLYSHQKGENKGAFTAENLLKMAKILKLDETKMKTCLDSKKYQSKVQKSTALGRRLNVNGTPTFFLNGVLMTDKTGQTGAFSYDVFKARIEKELAGKKKFIFF